MSLPEDGESPRPAPTRVTRSMPQLFGRSPYTGIATSSDEAASAVEALLGCQIARPMQLKSVSWIDPDSSRSTKPSTRTGEPKLKAEAVAHEFVDVPWQLADARHGPAVPRISSRHNSVMIDAVLAQDIANSASPRQFPMATPKQREETVRLLSDVSPSPKVPAAAGPRQVSQVMSEKAMSRQSGDLEIGLHESVMPWRDDTPPSPPTSEHEADAAEGDDKDDDDDDVDVFPRPLSPHRRLNISVLHETMFVGAVVMAQFMALAGLGQAISPMNIISVSLAVTDTGAQAWFAASYSLTVGTFILISGRIGDIVGHKRMFIIGYIFLGVWSGFAGFSVYLGRQIYFDICRAFQGLGAALLAPNALALLGRAYPPGLEKNLVFSLFGAMAPWGFVVGALYAAVFAEYIWWPWLFWSYGIAAWALAAFSSVVVPKQLAYDAQFASGRPRPGMDWTGCALGVIGLVLINIGWNNGPLLGWDDTSVYVVLAVGVASMLAFLVVETRAKSPILPVSAMSVPVVFTLALVSLGWAAFGVWIFYSWRFLGQLRGLAPISIVAEFTPALVVGLLAAGATGAMLTHTPVSFTMMMSMCAFFAGGAISAFQPVIQTYWAQMFVSIIIMPFGMDMSFPAATIILSNHMPREHQGLAASLVNTFVNYSISLGLGIAATVEAKFNNGGVTPADVEFGIRVAHWTGLGMSGCGVILGAMFFIRTMAKEGWKVMDH